MCILRKLSAMKQARIHAAAVKAFIRDNIRQKISYSLPKNIKLDVNTEEKAIPSDIQYSLAVDDGFFSEYHKWENSQKQMESFSAIVLRKIDERGMSAKDFYSKAGLGRKLFSKLKTDYCYQPNRKTAICCCLALGLDQKETDALLKSAGYALANTSSFDLEIQYCIAHEIFDLMDVNAILYELEERSL